MLLLVPLLAGLFFVAGRGDPAISKATKAVMVALADPLSLFAGRSPGGRGPGALLSTKPDKKTAAAEIGPEERVLSQVRDRDPDFGGLPALAGLNDPAFAPDPGVDGLPGGGGPGSISDPPGLLPVTSAVPEPATWAMLILGFFAVGAAMRRRRSVLRT
jgi:hypothetical protein